MSELRPQDFITFFKAVYGYQPFPWQVRLAEQVTAENGRWPDAISVPTASGKTACLDVAVFAMALQVDWPVAKVRTAPRRIFFVVDRRVIVEEAYLRARNLAKCLKHATSDSGIVGDVAKRLRQLAVGRTQLTAKENSKSDPQTSIDVSNWLKNQPPLACYQMRGGIYRDNAWARTPTQPAIIASTVDQIGSRLLYRGYGVSEFSRPLHAGLTANDSLIILDEAHCSNPFSQTMQAVDTYRGWCEVEVSDQAPFHFVSLTATPSGAARDVLRIEKQDEAFESHQEHDRRIRASKLAVLRVASKAKGKRWVQPLAVELADQARDLQKTLGAAAIGIIVNRVATAREVCKLLKSQFGENVALMTGRMREVDRRDFLDKWQPVLAAKPHLKEQRQLASPVFVVATQCLEVGANLDFDAMVSECASLDALRQRFGRLNRLGQRPVANAVIVIRSDQTELTDDPKKIDPIYGSALPKTWQWLTENATDGVIDLGIASVSGLLPADTTERDKLLDSLRPTSSDAPVMLPAHLDAFVQTSPAPCPDPDVGLFLHGLQRSAADIQVCWRADLVPTLMDGLAEGFTLESLPDTSDEVATNGAQAGMSTIDKLSRESNWIEAVTYCPPTASECLPVPLYLFEKWIETGRVDNDQLVDVEGVAIVEPESSGISWQPRPFLRWCGPNDKRTMILRDTRQLTPGDTVILPTWLGGFDCLGDVVGLDSVNAQTHPDQAAKADCGSVTNLIARHKPVLRIHELLVSQWPPCAARQKLIALAKDATLADRLTTPEFASELSEVLVQLANTEELVDRKWKWLRVAADALGRQLRRRSSRPRLHFMSYGWTFSTETQQLVQRNVANKGGFVVVGARLTADEANQLNNDNEDGASFADLFTHEDDSSSTGFVQPVTLRDHTQGVVDFADHFTSGSRLPKELVTDIRLAAKLHDLGKADSRFQAWLLGGSPRAARMTSELLAKSELSMDRTSNRLARERSAYPPGGRHELLSVRLVESAGGWLRHAHDPELVLHLVAAHHGYCRPFAPHIRDSTSNSLSEPFDLGRLANLIGMPTPANRLVTVQEVLPTKLEDCQRSYGSFLDPCETIWLVGSRMAGNSTDTGRSLREPARAGVRERQ